MLIIKNRIIDSPILDIVKSVQDLTNGRYFKDISDKGKDVVVTCPYHKDGNESHPSMGIYADKNGNDTQYGNAHCFTCNKSVSLVQLLSDVLGKSTRDVEKWLISNYSHSISEQILELPEIEIKKYNSIPLYNRCDMSLTRNLSYHPYLAKRKLPKEVTDYFHVGYNSRTKTIVMPVWDEYNNLSMITQRSVEGKHFFIEKNAQKPIYLYNYIKYQNYPYVIVTEGQIDALTAWAYGVPAIALIGVGSKHQYNILNKSEIRNYILMFDNDNAGIIASNKFIKNIRKDVVVTTVKIPDGYKDINDMPKDAFVNLLKSYNYYPLF